MLMIQRKGEWICARTLMPEVGVMRLWQTDSGLMAVGYLSDDKRLVYMSDDNTRYLHASDMAAHQAPPPKFRDRHSHHNPEPEYMREDDETTGSNRASQLADDSPKSQDDQTL